MKSEEFRLTLLHAVAGDHEAIEKIIMLYMPLINKYSVIDDVLDEDCRQYIMLRIAMTISKFQLSEK